MLWTLLWLKNFQFQGISNKFHFIMGELSKLHSEKILMNLTSNSYAKVFIQLEFEQQWYFSKPKMYDRLCTHSDNFTPVWVWLIHVLQKTCAMTYARTCILTLTSCEVCACTHPIQCFDQSSINFSKLMVSLDELISKGISEGRIWTC